MTVPDLGFSFSERRTATESWRRHMTSLLCSPPPRASAAMRQLGQARSEQSEHLRRVRVGGIIHRDNSSDESL